MSRGGTCDNVRTVMIYYGVRVCTRDRVKPTQLLDFYAVVIDSPDDYYYITFYAIRIF